MCQRLLTVACGLVLALPGAAGADYLTSAFRDGCAADPAKHYSAADPVIGTVPMVESEIDRVSSNMLVYTGFTVPSTGSDRYRGHVYGVRLFKELTEYGNDWDWTDTSPDSGSLFDVCGQADAACIFDAGQMLADRKAAGVARRILVGKPGDAVEDGGAITMPIEDLVEVPTAFASTALRGVWDAYLDVDPVQAAMPYRIFEAGGFAYWSCDFFPDVPESLCKRAAGSNARNLSNPSDDHLNTLGRWLHGDDRSWPLGDVYHASATIVEPPAYDYLDRFYPEFRAALKERPSMIYVGANDGQIHAFYASPDLHCEDEVANPDSQCPRWEQGEEAWSYVPASMLSRALVASERGEERFFSQDLSCRFTDVQVDRAYRTECTESDQEDDPYCGWRTVLLCGQGWGGSWYVALDVTEPDNPRPMWEFTDAKLGRTWSVPSVSLVPMHDSSTGRTEPFWVATFGSGYNNEMKDCGNYKSGPKRCDAVWPTRNAASYRLLNLEFDGAFPQHGQGAGSDVGSVFVQDVATGRLIERFDQGASGTPFVADGTVLDFNYDGFVDAAYMGQYKGINRVRFGRTVSDMEMCSLTTVGNQQILTGHPTAFAYSVDPEAEEFPVVLVTGAGLDSGKDPDQQSNQGNNWSVDSHLFMERVDASCISGGYYCDLAPGYNGFNDGSRKARLLGAPLFSRQANKDDWIIYTVWTAPHFNKVDNCPSGDEKTTGTAHLFCMDVTLVAKEGGAEGETEPRCEPCIGFETTGAAGNVIYENESNPPTAPVSADGRVYLTDPNSGLATRGIESSDGEPKPNSNPPSAAVPARLVSWREVY